MLPLSGLQGQLWCMPLLKCFRFSPWSLGAFLTLGAGPTTCEEWVSCRLAWDPCVERCWTSTAYVVWCWVLSCLGELGGSEVCLGVCRQSERSQGQPQLAHLGTVIMQWALRSRGMVGCDGLLATGWPVCCYPRHRRVSWTGCRVAPWAPWHATDATKCGSFMDSGGLSMSAKHSTA